jgi:2-keto-3-deoxy-L-rhamnonate aldolase RhmA
MELRSTAVANLLSEAGLDFLLIDMEHGPYDLETASEIIRMARQVGITPLVRIAELTKGTVGRLLDAGAQGLMLPGVEQAETASTFVDYCKYPPEGKRGMNAGVGNTDFKWVNTAEYINFINDEILVIVQIESRGGVDNLDSLLRVPGVDVYFIGPEDLSISLDLPGQQRHPQVTEAIQHIASQVASQQRFSGIHVGDPETLATYRDQGINFLTYSSDIEFIYNGVLQGLHAFQGT